MQEDQQVQLRPGLLSDGRDLKIAAPTTLKDMVAQNAHSRHDVGMLHGPLAFAALRRSNQQSGKLLWSNFGSSHALQSPLSQGVNATFFFTVNGDDTTLAPRVYGKRLNLNGRVDAGVMPPLTAGGGPQCREPSLSTSIRVPAGGRGGCSRSLGLHLGQGIPAPPQPKPCSPSQGLSEWFSHNQPVSSQRAHFIFGEFRCSVRSFDPFRNVNWSHSPLWPKGIERTSGDILRVN